MLLFIFNYLSILVYLQPSGLCLPSFDLFWGELTLNSNPCRHGRRRFNFLDIWPFLFCHESFEFLVYINLSLISRNQKVFDSYIIMCKVYPNLQVGITPSLNHIMLKKNNYDKANRLTISRLSLESCFSSLFASLFNSVIYR